MVKLVMRNLASTVITKKTLSKLKVPENYNEAKVEGYDGHLEWEGDTNKMLCLKYEFYHKVRKLRQDRNIDEIMEIFESLGVAATEIQMKYLCDLLQESESAEMAKEALLISICIGSRPLVELILTLFQDYPHEERAGCANSAAFQPHMTPLMLACILNNFAIVQCLLLRNHSIDIPHHEMCKCDVCLLVTNSNMSEIRRADVFRALCSEAYLWLATDDPFAAACSLSRDLSTCIDNDSFQFIDTYRVLYNDLQKFTSRLIDHNWRVEELDIFLAHKCHCSTRNCRNPYPRVQLALDAHMRYFAGSPSVQRAMDCIWYRGWGNFGANLSRDSYRILRHVFLYPVLAFLYLASRGKIGSSFKVPLARYISHTASYVCFLFCWILVRGTRMGKTMKTVHTPGRDLVAFSLEAYCYIYIGGLSMEKYMQFCRYGFSNYFHFWWRWFDFMFLGIFWLCFHLWFTGLCMTGTPDLEELNRIHWPQWDYYVIYDIFVCTGCILGIWRIFYFFQLIKGLGGSVISVGRCVGTIYNYLIVMGVILISFAVGIYILVQPYLNSIVVNEDLSTKKMGNEFGSIPHAMRKLYWAVYGYLEPDSYYIVTGNSGPDRTPTVHGFTSFATEAIITLYHAIIVITLLNLMVSLLVKKADEVLENEDSEFKYTRIVIYSEFIDWSSTLPPPFNLAHIALVKLGILPDDKDAPTKEELLQPVSKDPARDCEIYNDLMMSLFSRFRASKECHYRGIYRTEFDKDRANAESNAKVAFMNSYNDRFDVFDCENQRSDRTQSLTN